MGRATVIVWLKAIFNWVVKLSFPDRKINYCSSLQFILASPRSVSWGSGEGVWDIPKYARDDLFSPHVITPPSRRMAYLHVEVGVYVTVAVLSSFLLKDMTLITVVGSQTSSYMFMCVCAFTDGFVFFLNTGERIAGSASCSQIWSLCPTGAMQFAQEAFPSSGMAWKIFTWLTAFCSMGLFGEMVSNSRLLFFRLPKLSQISTQKCMMILCVVHESRI